MFGQVTFAAAEKVDLSGGWDQFWSALKGASGMDQILNLMTIIGVIIVVFALLKWTWDRRRGGGFGGGGGSGGVWGALLVGAVLTAPALLFPIMLTVLDVIANAVVSIWNKSDA